jgi:hypothetical protein
MPKSGACWLLSVLHAGVMSKPDATLAEMQAWLIAEHDVRVSAGVPLDKTRAFGLTLKKSHYAPLNRTAPISPKPVRKWRVFRLRAR